MKIVALLILMALLAGCTELDEARQDMDQARADLQQAQADAQEAKARYERVRSATIVREETLRVVVVPMSNNTTLRFDVAAWRGDPLENGTALAPGEFLAVPSIRLRAGPRVLECDPIACALSVGEDVNVTWADGAPGAFTLAGGHAACAVNSPTDGYCRFPELERFATIRVTTPLDDVTR